MKFFNYRYMIQNLKKSKSILAFFLGIFPVISILSFLAIINTNSLANANLEMISIIHFIGIYVIPIILSFCLFGFVYKKKSVDFALSMPISRRTIFTTNTITGILLLILMVFLCAISIFITSLFTPVILPFRMILDYLFIWGSTYIFVFILTNIAMSVSGNRITQFVVTMLLLFFLPFFIDSCHFPNILDISYSDLSICFDINIMNGTCIYTTPSHVSNFTLPYNIIRSFLVSWKSLYNIVSIFKMLVIAIIGFIIGKKLFLKRKMEINETSFQNLKTHNIVKAFTMFPIVMIISTFITNDSMNLLGAIISLVILLSYYLIYDFITRHSLANLKKTGIHFVVTLLILFPVCIIITNQESHSYTKSISITDIDEISNYKLSLYHNNYSSFDYVLVTDKNMIQMISDSLNHFDEAVNDQEIEESIYREIIVTIDHHEYLLHGRFLKEDYDKIQDAIQKQTNQKTNTLLDGNAVYALGVEENYLTHYTNDQKILAEAKKVIRNHATKKEEYKACYNLVLYAYQDGVISSYSIDSCSSDILNDYVNQVLISENKKIYEKIKNVNYHSPARATMSIALLTEPKTDMLSVDTESFRQRFYGRLKLIYRFMQQHAKDSFSTSEDYISFGGYYDGKKFIFHTNQIEEFVQLIEEDDSYDFD